MVNFRVEFSNPWWLLLIIPAIALALIPYFRLSKKYRKTRNRIISIVLYFSIVVLSASVLSGIAFAYDEPITSNQILLLVDLSHSNRNSLAEKNDFIESILDESASQYQMGIVTFGKNQIYAAEFSNNIDIVKQQFLKAQKPNEPDESGTDIAAAIKYGRTLFEDQSVGRMVLITDGIETDGNAMALIMSLSNGIRIDTVFFPNHLGTEVQLIDVEFPDYNIEINTPISISVKAQSSYIGTATLTVFNNGVKGASSKINLRRGIDTFTVEHMFKERGPQEIRVEIKCDNGKDIVEENNKYYAFFYLGIYDKILIIDRGDESTLLKELLKDDFDITVVSVDKVPATLDELRQYDEVILMNIASASLPTEFFSMLNTYVNKLGGGLLTVGGEDRYDETDANGEHIPNAYNRIDMAGSLLQSMLPVESINYTPPLGLMIVVDKSGSMSQPVGNNTRLGLAIEGALACLTGLTNRDYVGVISFGDAKDLTIEIPMTPMTQKLKIEEAILNIGTSGGTVYYGAIQAAGMELMALDRVEKKHIMFITDGEPGDRHWANEDRSILGFMDLIQHYNENGITLSAISIVNNGGAPQSVIEEMASVGGGKPYIVEDPQKLPEIMYSDLKIPQIIDIIPEPFTPIIRSQGATEMRGIPLGILPQLGGFYGTRLKRDAQNIIGTEYVPVYAKWKYGNGRVGSFLCDLRGDWSGEFLADENGRTFIKNVLRALAPTEDIKQRNFELEVTKKNFSMLVSVFPNIALNSGDSIKVTVVSPTDTFIDSKTFDWATLPDLQNIQSVVMDSTNRAQFDYSESGTYQIVVQRFNSNGNLVNESEIFYSTFSYSAEYDEYMEPNIDLEALALATGGTMITDPPDIFGLYNPVIPHSYDPYIEFITIALILFLLDVAVKKFKFKWPWEIIRARKAFIYHKNI